MEQNTIKADQQLQGWGAWEVTANGNGVSFEENALKLYVTTVIQLCKYMKTH